MARLNLASPWILYYHKVKALFSDDQEIHVIFDDEHMDLKLYVNDELKAEALELLFPYEKSWGETVLTITIIPSNKESGLKLVSTKPLEPTDLIFFAFDGNPHFSDIIHVDTLFNIIYVIFKNEVIQYYSDRLDNPHGLTSVLAEDLARELFETPANVYYCTDIK